MTAAALLAATGLAAAAHAQTWTWLAEVEHPVIDPAKGITTQTVTLSALMEHEGAETVYLAATIFDTLGAMNADRGQITGWQILNSLDELTGDLTTTDGVSLYNTNAGQLCLWGPCTTDNPVEVLEFTWELADPGAFDVMYLTNTESAVYKAGSDHDDVEVYNAEVIIEGQIGWTVVPAPPAIALGAGALPLLLRRSRR